jgi:cytochrome c oxidase subunit III
MSHTDAAHGGHGHGDHAHSPFLAHHFDDPEQQYDSGKLGIWLFLVTEVLFFSGMFCAYALYRSRNPEVFTFSSQFLNAKLGAFNTGVLLFSSLSMAWGVRCAQLRQRTGLVVCLAITLGCASMFLGVKAIEYTHKWDLGLLPAGGYISQYSVTEHHEGVSQWLYTLSIVPALCVVGFLGWYVMTIVQGNKRHTEIAGPLLVTALCYFLGVFIGIAFESAEAAAHSDHGAAHGHSGEHHHDGEHKDGVHKEGDHGAGDHGAAGHADEAHGEEAHGTEAGDDHSGVMQPKSTRLVSVEAPRPVPGAATIESVDQKGGAGLFFSIYYCMTGVHAIHILGGMAVLAWLLARATKDQFNEEYFGPVDYVGLYWHLVDLIWIYLFPLLYLIK